MNERDYSEECKKCGLCCIYYPTLSKNNDYQWGNIRDSETQVPRKLYRITRKPIHKIWENDPDPEPVTKKFIKQKTDPYWRGFKRCVALEGIPKEDAKCSVYQNRPKVCSEFKPGGSICNEIREWGGLEKI